MNQIESHSNVLWYCHCKNLTFSFHISQLYVIIHSAFRFCYLCTLHIRIVSYRFCYYFSLAVAFDVFVLVNFRFLLLFFGSGDVDRVFFYYFVVLLSFNHEIYLPFDVIEDVRRVWIKGEKWDHYSSLKARQKLLKKNNWNIIILENTCLAFKFITFVLNF